MNPLTDYTENLSKYFHLKTGNKATKIESGTNAIAKCKLDELFYFEYTCIPLVDEELTVCTTSIEGFYFLYCEQGELEVTLANGSSDIITPFKSALIFDENADGVKIKILKNEGYHFCVVGCDKPHGRGEIQKVSSYDQYKESFCTLTPEGSHIYIGKPCLKLANKVKKLSQLCDKNVPSRLIMQGLIYEIFGIKLEQILEMINDDRPDYGSLSSREIRAVKAVAEFIRKDPSRDYTIEFLCRQTGLSPAKLQEGFKKMYDNTVINYIRNIRLERATELIQSTDLNISEIVYSIGLTSRSYFSKIFRNKYDCSPKFFQDQNRTFSKLP